MGESIHIVGPERVTDKWIFLCPECDDDRVDGIPADVTRVCTVEWLEGQQLIGDDKLGGRTCYCWQTDPFEGEDDATDRSRRYFYYRTLAFKLGGSGRRVDLPLCVKEKIEELFGQSTVGFSGN